MKELEKNDCTCADHCDCNKDGHDCGCHNEPVILEMEDENGEKVKVEIVATFDDNNKSYAVANDLDNEENSYLFEVQSTKDGDMLVSVDDEKEFDRLCNVVENLISQDNEE